MRPELTHTDDGGNTLVFDGRFLTLRLASGEIRRLGCVRERIWHIERKRQEQARGLGHWHFAAGCWLINYYVAHFHSIFGFDAVHLTGYDEDGKFYDITRPIEKVLRGAEVHFYKWQGFERQIEFRIEESTQGDLFAEVP